MSYSEDKLYRAEQRIEELEDKVTDLIKALGHLQTNVIVMAENQKTLVEILERRTP